MAKKLEKIQFIRGPRAGEVADVSAKQAAAAIANGQAKAVVSEAPKAPKSEPLKSQAAS